MADDRSEPSKPPNRSNEQPTRTDWFPWALGGGSRHVSSGSRRILLITLAACLCVVAAGVSVAVFSSPGGSQAGHIAGASNSPAATTTQAAQPTAPTAPTASSRATTGPDVTSNGVSKSALQWPPQLKRQMLRWWAGSGGAALTAVETQMGHAMQDAGLKLYSPMRLACASLASDIGTAQAGPPIPYDAMQRLYARALDGLSGAAADCRTAISVHANGNEGVEIHLDRVLLNRSRAEFATMSKKLYTATAEIQALGR